MSVKGKIANVSDEVCVSCPQNWYGECRAYLMPHSKEERLYRISQLPNAGNCDKWERREDGFPIGLKLE